MSPLGPYFLASVEQILHFRCSPLPPSPLIRTNVEAMRSSQRDGKQISHPLQRIRRAGKWETV
jgi:hypothetical protein